MGLIDFFKNRSKAKEITQEKKRREKHTVALCLGGGGARGFAHIGVIKALEENNIDFDLVVGTSAGSIVGSLYASGMSAKQMIAYADTISLKDVHNGIILVPNDAGKIARIITKALGDINIEQLKKRFVAVAVDLVEGKQAILEKGNVGMAVAASCCVPLFFRPVVIGDKHLVDGGLLNNIPADIARMLGADIVITSDINPTRGGATSSLKSLDVIKATFNIMSANSSIQGLINSDVLIAPDMSKYKATDKEGYEEMIELGYREALTKTDQIKELLK